MKIAICDSLGLCYDGTTLSKQGLGGSESAVILIAKNLQELGFQVTVFNNCKDGSNSKPGIYDSVRYIDNTDAKDHDEEYDIVIVSRTVAPFLTQNWPFVHTAKKRVLWLHDTFIEGDQIMEDLVVSGKIDHVFTLSDWHTSYTSIKCDHIGSTTFSLDTHAEKNIEAVAAQDLLPNETVKYLESMTSKPKVIYDIGSCVLHWQRHAKRIWPNSEIYLFEANRDVKKLYDNTQQKYHLGVLTDVDNKPVKFYKDPMNLGGNSYYKENTVHYNETHAMHEVGETLDTVIIRNKWPLPDLMKIDVQGAEIDILKGAENCIANCTDVILEAQHVEYNHGAPRFEQVIEYMNSKGFELVSSFSRTAHDCDYHFKRT